MKQLFYIVKKCPVCNFQTTSMYSETNFKKSEYCLFHKLKKLSNHIHSEMEKRYEYPVL